MTEANRCSRSTGAAFDGCAESVEMGVPFSRVPGGTGLWRSLRSGSRSEGRRRILLVRRSHPSKASMAMARRVSFSVNASSSCVERVSVTLFQRMSMSG